MSLDWGNLFPGVCPWRTLVLPCLQAMSQEVDRGGVVWLNPDNWWKVYTRSKDVLSDLDCVVKAHVVLLIRFSVVTGDTEWLNEEVVCGLAEALGPGAYVLPWEERTDRYYRLLERMSRASHVVILDSLGWWDPFTTPKGYRWGGRLSEVAKRCCSTGSTALLVLFFITTGRTCSSCLKDDGEEDGVAGLSSLLSRTGFGDRGKEG